MNENDSRDLLLVQAFEGIANPTWSAEDRQWASDAAAREVGSDSTGERFLVARARLGAGRLRERDATARSLTRAARWPAGAGGLVAVTGLVAGFVGDAAGADRFVNLLAPPVLALLAWNLLLYVGLGLAALRRARPPRSPLTRLWQRLLSARLRRTDPGQPAIAMRFARAWSDATGPLTASRIARTLHVAAALVAIGAMAGLYLRGLAFEYRAGWASTFLEAEQVARLLAFVYGPASALTGIELPDAERIARLRLPEAPGERAADWIHLQATTLLLAVVGPRLVLAAFARNRERRFADSIPLPLHEPYFATLARARGGAAAVVQVIPYATELGQHGRDMLASLIAGAFGSGVEVRVAPSVAFGDEIPSAPSIGGCGADWYIVLFRLAATPEREVQLRYLERLRERLPSGRPLAVLVDDASFRARFADPDRLGQRTDAWRRILDDFDAPAVFVSLAPDAHDASVRALADGIESVAARPA